MKRYKYLSIFFILIALLSLFSISVSAVENTQFAVSLGPEPTYFDIDGEYTWREYIDKYSPEGFTVSNTGVYYYSYQLACLSLSIDDGRFPLPDDLIQTEYGYDAVPCDHEYSYLMSGSLPCQYKTIMYTCITCGYSFNESFDPSIEHEYVIDLDSYIEPSCAAEGYAKYECVYCGLYYSETTLELNPDYHNNVIDATCDESSYCADCGIVFFEPLGHDLNVWGKCKRQGCDYGFNIGNIGMGSDSDSNNENSFDVGDSVTSVATVSVSFLIVYYIFTALSPFLLKIIDIKSKGSDKKRSKKQRKE